MLELDVWLGVHRECEYWRWDCLLMIVAWNVVDWETTRTSRFAVTQYMYAPEWAISNLTLWPLGLDDSMTKEGSSHVREPNQQSRVFCVCLGCRVEQAVEVGGSGCIYVQDTVLPIQARADD
jgi:hypothetical protein